MQCVIEWGWRLMAVGARRARENIANANDRARNDAPPRGTASSAAIAAAFTIHRRSRRCSPPSTSMIIICKDDFEQKMASKGVAPV